MNDYRNAMYDHVSKGIESRFANITLSSTDFSSKPKLPALQFVQLDSYVDDTSSESSNIEVRTICVFEGQAYSAKSYSEAFSIIRECDRLLGSCGFRRTMLSSVDDSDLTIRRVVARWRGAIDTQGRVSR